MRKFAVALALTALAAFPAMAVNSNYHYNTAMKCSDCHSMHASAHTIDGVAVTSPTQGTDRDAMYFPAATAPQHYLLKAQHVCESCHDGQTFAPDVVGANTNSYVRSAGGVHEDGAVPAGAGGHVIGSSVRPPGYSTDTTAIGGYYSAVQPLECYSCHSPHGSANFRNLVPYQMRTTVTDSAAVGPTVARNAAFQAGSDVTILGADTYTFGSGLANYYGRDKVMYANNAAVPFNGTTASNRMDQFCGVCHGNFHGGSAADTTTVGNGTTFVRHPTSTAKIGSIPAQTLAASTQGLNNLKVYQTAATFAAANDSPGCLTCHKAHGNNNPFALIYPSTSAADTTEEGAGTYKSLCKSCHGMGGTAMN